MKILAPSQIADADRATIKNMPITSINLMERAATQCYHWILSHFTKKTPVFIFCGTGNNGGDGLVIARLLKFSGFSVQTFILHFGKKSSEDFRINLNRLKAINGSISPIESSSDFPSIPQNALIIDAIFGNGLNRKPEGLAALAIHYINEISAYKLSIDLPSGLFANQPTNTPPAVLKADYVLTFQTPKLAFFLPDNKNFIKNWEILDIGLDEKYIQNLHTQFFYFTKKEAQNIYRSRTNRWAHKGTFGHSLIIGGSYGKMGAAVLAAKAALVMGSGLVTAHIPACGYEILQTSVPEVMTTTAGNKFLEDFTPAVQANAIGIGCGIGTSEETRKAFRNFLQKSETPLILDADALNCLALEPDLAKILPPQSILTPHPKELERLVGKWKNDYEKMQKVLAFSQKNKAIIIVKGAYTMIASEGSFYFNSSGNVALATAGSGDVLTGIITGLLAQGYAPLQAAQLGVYLHGKTADIFAKKHAAETFIASQIIDYLSKAIKSLHK